MKSKFLTGLVFLIAAQAQAFTSGEKVLDISRGVFAKIVDESSNGTFAIQHMTGPLSQIVLEGFSQDQLGAIKGRVKNITVGDIVYDSYRKADALVIALSGDNKFVIRHLSGSYAGKFLAGYSVEYLKTDVDMSQQMKLDTVMKPMKSEDIASKPVEKAVAKPEAQKVVEVKTVKVEEKKVVPVKKEIVKEVAPVEEKKSVKNQDEPMPIIKSDLKNKKAAVFNMLLKRNLED